MIIKINRDGTVTCIHHGQLDQAVQSVLGKAVTRRASHVEPINAILRWVFHTIRSRVSDDSQLAGWTRTWQCTWRARIFNGPTLQPFSDRQAAADAEVKWLRENRI